MKGILSAIIIYGLAIALSACGVSGAYVYNHNQNSTQVHLSKNNYKVLSEISGSADVDYVLVFGGLNKRKLYAQAYADMMSKADLNNGSKAIVNLITEENLAGVPPLYYTRTITVSAHVIEFSE